MQAGGNTPALTPSCCPPPCLQPAGEFREYYLPLSKEEIEHDIEHLGSLLEKMHREQAQAAANGKRRAVGARLGGGAHAAAQHAAAGQGPDSSDELSPSSQQGEDENESANPSDAQHNQHQQQWGGPKGGAVAPVGVGAGAPEQQQQVAMA